MPTPRIMMQSDTRCINHGPSFSMPIAEGNKGAQLIPEVLVTAQIELQKEENELT